MYILDECVGHVNSRAPRIARRCPRCGSTNIVRRPGPNPRFEELRCGTCREHVLWRGTPPGIQAALSYQPPGLSVSLRDLPIADIARLVRAGELAADVLSHLAAMYGNVVESEAVEEWGWQP